ncbi:SprB repeat-containing protein [Solitalea longa]|nr:SprB repeat-containing protein [Solitalea longa]
MQTSFPVFDADQVLTNTHLNDLRKYLDEQNRLTRAKLIGCGIVCGLELVVSSSSIKISKGCGLTSQGFLIPLCDSEYTHVIPYTAPEFPEDFDLISQCDSSATGSVPFYKPDFTEPMQQLLTAAQLEALSSDVKATAVTLSSMTNATLSELAVVLFLEAEQLKLKNCDTNDCNDKGSRMDFEPKVLLVKKSVLDKINANFNGNIAKNPLPHLELKRYNVPVKNVLTTSAVLAAFATITDDVTIDKIDEALNSSYTNYSFLLKEPTGNPFGGIGNTLKSIRQKIITNNPLFIQYFYDFLDDLVKTYYEFREKAYYVNSECCTDEMRFPLHLMLGEATVSTLPGKQSAYREFFIYSPLFDSQNYRLGEIRFLFTKLKLLILNFAPDLPSAFEKRTIKITPSSFGKTYLSQRSVPYYYELKPTSTQASLLQFWNYKKTVEGEADFNLGYKSNEYADSTNTLVREPLLYDIERYNFFRVEGHLGKQINPALTGVLAIKQEFNLPMEVIALSADYIGAILQGKEPKCVIQDLESDYRLVIAEFMCKLHDAFCNIYRFDFKPKSRDLAVIKAKADAGFLAAADDEEDDNEVNELIGKIDFVGLNVNHPILSRLVSESHLTKIYQKGSSLLKICGVRKGSIGDIYLSNIADNIFTNPISLGTKIKAASLYFRFFELIDSIESMFKILLTNELSELNMTEFKTAYNRYEKAVKNLNRQLKTITDKVQVFLSTCIVEILEALKDEYRRRMNQYKLAQKFNNYFKTHGGVEHKAGVTKGGTFILVYFEDTRNRRFDVSALFVNKNLGRLMLAKHPDLIDRDVSDEEIKKATDELHSAVEFKCPEQFTFITNTVKDFLDADKNIPAASREALLAALRKAPERAAFPFPSGTVIADFYVPYICCSDCSPVSYVLQSAEPAPLRVAVSDPLCNEKGTEYTVTVEVDGGTPPYTITVNGNPITGQIIVLKSGSPDAKVGVKDAEGKTADAVIKSHTCKVPCDLPCNGNSTACHYILWISKPVNRLPMEPRKASLNLVDENLKQTNIDLTNELASTLIPRNNLITPNNFDAIFKELVERINKLIPAPFANPMLRYDEENRLLIIDKFDCHDFKLSFEVLLVINDQQLILTILYDKTGVAILDQTGKLLSFVPPFGCIQLNKCTGEKIDKCANKPVIKELVGNQVEFNKPVFEFSIQPDFNSYFWYFQSGLPLYSTNAKPQTQIQGGDPVVRVIGITKEGCFAVREEKVKLNIIVGDNRDNKRKPIKPKGKNK